LKNLIVRRQKVSWRVIKNKKKKKGVFGVLSGVELSIDNKRVIDTTLGYVNCSKIDFDSKTKTIELS